jgi:hypothetical protein
MRSRVQPRKSSVVCPYCRADVLLDESVACAGCGVRHHRECWHLSVREYGGCSVYGCGSRAGKRRCAAATWGQVLAVPLMFLVGVPTAIASVGLACAVSQVFASSAVFVVLFPGAVLFTVLVTSGVARACGLRIDRR